MWNGIPREVHATELRQFSAVATEVFPAPWPWAHLSPRPRPTTSGSRWRPEPSRPSPALPGTAQCCHAPRPHRDHACVSSGILLPSFAGDPRCLGFMGIC